jgi:hypothetical protein
MRVEILSFIEQKDGMERIMCSSWFESCTVKLVWQRTGAVKRFSITGVVYLIGGRLWIQFVLAHSILFHHHTRPLKY